MSKVWLVAWNDYVRLVWRRSFILLLLSVPVAIALAVGMGAYMDARGRSNAPAGYVDQSGVLANAIPAPASGRAPDEAGGAALVPLIAFDTEASARVALQAGEIQAYYVVAADYLQTRRVELVYRDPPGDNLWGQFRDFMQVNELGGLPRERASRAVAGPNLIVRWPDDVWGGGREFSADSFLGNLLPLFAVLAFLILVASSSGHLMQAVVDEKENRTMEVVVTSLSPGQFIAGKVIANAGVALTQLAGWGAFAALATVIGGHWLGMAFLRNLHVDWRIAGTMAVIAVPSYVTVAALLTAIGATVAQAQEAQQISGLLGLLSAVPFWFAGPVMENPEGLVALALSLFPGTALSTYGLRLTFTRVPPWQVALSTAILTTSALAAIWLAGRAFRLGMLRYGQRVRWRELLQVRHGGEHA